MPAPALVKVTLVPEITPVIVPVALLVTESAPLDAKVIAFALSVPVVTVKPVNAVVPPTVLPKVVAPPALLTVKP